MAEPKLEKVKPAEYAAVKTAEQDQIVKTIPEPEATDASTDEWSVGKSAPSTKYLDKKTGKITDAQPVSGKVIVFKDDVVTYSIHEQLVNNK